MKIDFRDYPIGTRVWDLSLGWGTIKRTDGEVNDYPIYVAFDEGLSETYSVGGKRLNGCLSPCLFLNEFEIPERAYKQPLPELEVDAPILVRNNKTELWKRRSFTCWHEGNRVKTYISCGTKWTTKGQTQVWRFWRLPTKKELNN